MTQASSSSLPDWASVKDELAFGTDLLFYGNACCKVNHSGLLEHIPLADIQDDRLKEIIK